MILTARQLPPHVVGWNGEDLRSIYMWRETRWEMQRLSPWRSSDKRVYEPKRGSSFTNASTIGWIYWRNDCQRRHPLCGPGDASGVCYASRVDRGDRGGTGGTKASSNAATANDALSPLWSLAACPSDHIAHEVVGELTEGLTVLSVSPTVEEIRQKIAPVAEGKEVAAYRGVGY